MLERVATAEELDRCWTIDRIADANEALDALHEAKQDAAQVPK